VLYLNRGRTQLCMCTHFGLANHRILSGDAAARVLVNRSKFVTEAAIATDGVYTNPSPKLFPRNALHVLTSLDIARRSRSSPSRCSSSGSSRRRASACTIPL
jgi:hypothetical protein